MAPLSCCDASWWQNLVLHCPRSIPWKFLSRLDQGLKSDGLLNCYSTDLPLGHFLPIELLLNSAPIDTSPIPHWSANVLDWRSLFNSSPRTSRCRSSPDWFQNYWNPWWSSRAHPQTFFVHPPSIGTWQIFMKIFDSSSKGSIVGSPSMLFLAKMASAPFIWNICSTS